MTPFNKPIYVTRPYLPDLSEYVRQLEDVWSERWLTNNGPQQILLEGKLCGYMSVRHLSLFNNGTMALLTACRVLELSGEVITTPFTFPATIHVLALSNLKPVFCDIDPVTMNIDPEKIEELITPETSAILAVHVFGRPCDLTQIKEIADRNGLKVIYDAAHAFGVEVDGTGIGNFGDASMFSFHATKTFHTAEGGALTFKDEALKTRADLFRNFGIKNEEEVVMPGLNCKMNELQAALGLVNLRYLGEERNKRRRLVEIYRERLRDIPGITISHDLEGVKTNYQYFVIRIDEDVFGSSRDHLYDRFKEYNVFTRKYFYPLCSGYQFYSGLPSAAAEDLPVAGKVAEEVLSLPLYGQLKEDDVRKICDILLDIRGKDCE